jgi:hypothetical protein
MDDATLLIQLISCLDAGIAEYNTLEGVPALPAGTISQKAFQPRQEGAPTAPAIIVNLARLVPRGFPKKKNTWNTTTSVMTRTHGQRMEATFHVEALVPQSPATPEAMTAAGVLNVARYILQNDATMATLAAQDVWLLRIDKMDSNYIEDDANQNENVPFFEITFVYRSAITVGTPFVDKFNPVFGRV